jgi:hypothetical protein
MEAQLTALLFVRTLMCLVISVTRLSLQAQRDKETAQSCPCLIPKQVWYSCCLLSSVLSL